LFSVIFYASRHYCPSVADNIPSLADIISSPGINGKEQNTLVKFRIQEPGVRSQEKNIKKTSFTKIKTVRTMLLHGKKYVSIQYFVFRFFSDS